MLSIQQLKNYFEEKNFWGIISVIQNGETNIMLPLGLRDLQNKLPNNEQTRFGIASGTKTFTALGIIKLVEQGVLDYSTKVCEVLKKEVTYIDREATIRQLLNHTSGTYDYLDEELIEDWDNFELPIPNCKLESPADYLPMFEGHKPKFKPGERYSYSNGGYILLGHIIELVTNQPYKDYIQDNVLNPLGMKSSGFYDFNDLQENTALGYIGTEEHLISNIYHLPKIGASDGGMYTTVGDLNLFWTGLFKGELISQESLKQFTQKGCSIWNGFAHYGLGVYMYTLQEHPCFTTIGGDAGVGFQSCYMPDLNVTMSIISNKTDLHQEMVSTVENWIFDHLK